LLSLFFYRLGPYKNRLLVFVWASVASSSSVNKIRLPFEFYKENIYGKYKNDFQINVGH
jgi:hypothetical protein